MDNQKESIVVGKGSKASRLTSRFTALGRMNKKKLVILIGLFIVAISLMSYMAFERYDSRSQQISNDDTEIYVINGKEMAIPKEFIELGENPNITEHPPIEERIKNLEVRIANGQGDYETHYLLAGFYYEYKNIASAIDNYKLAKSKLDPQLDGYQQAIIAIDDKVKRLESEL